MDGVPLTTFDIAALGVVILSALLALWRGLTREVLSISAWIGAGFAAVLAFPRSKEFARQYIETEWIADALALILVFVVVLAALTLITHQFARLVRGSALSAVDRSLGFVFGAVRGGILVCLAYLIMAWLWVEDERPIWLAEARTLPAVEAGAEAIKGLIPQAGLDAAAAQAEDMRRQAEEAQKAQELLQRLAVPQPESADRPQDSGYTERDRNAIDRLVETKDN